MTQQRDSSDDAQTIRALETLEFSALSAAVRSGPSVPGPLRFIPETCGLQEAPTAVARFRESGARQAVLVILYHPYDFKETGNARATIALDEFSELVNWCSDQPEIKLLSLKQISQRLGESAGASRLSANKECFSRGALIDDTFGGLVPRSGLVYWTEEELRPFIRVKMITIAICSFLLLAALGSGSYVVSARVRRRRLGAAGLGALLLFSLVVACYVMWDGVAGKEGGVAILACGALVVGTLLGCRKGGPSQETCRRR